MRAARTLVVEAGVMEIHDFPWKKFMIAGKNDLAYVEALAPISFHERLLSTGLLRQLTVDYSFSLH